MGEKFNLGFENVQSVYEDLERTVWVSTFGKGVYKLIPDQEREHVYARVVHFSTQNGLQK
ncbi:MAG: hypothetical protein MZV64_70210 [Ignavibacteriales bacterium]|nr:hypothetical protein [Ignavibacteriales bacterium]